MKTNNRLLPLFQQLLRQPLFYLSLVVFLGGGFRFYNSDWDLKHSFHPDERNILGQTSAIQGSAGYKVQFFAYGQLPVYLYRATGELVSPPQFLFDKLQGNFFLARALYVLLFLAGLGCCWRFFDAVRQFIRWLKATKSTRPPGALVSLDRVLALGPLVFMGFLTISLFGSFQDFNACVQADYWLFLALLLYGILWFFPMESFKEAAFGLSASMFSLTLFLKFFDVFAIWFTSVDGEHLTLQLPSFLRMQSQEIPIVPLVCLLLVGVLAFGSSGIFSKISGIKWSEIPCYAACGTTFLLGVVPFFLPLQVQWPRVLGVLTVTLLATAVFVWFAWMAWSARYKLVLNGMLAFLSFGLLAFILLKFAPVLLSGPNQLPTLEAAFALTLLVVVGGAWLAWVSSWGRVILALLASWTFFASATHGGQQYVGYGECMIIGRWWAALFSTITILAVYFFVKNAYQKTGMALLAAAAFAFAVVSIEQAHYCITESFITLMCVVTAITAYGIVREKGSWRSYLLAGAAFGLSMAAKTSSLFYVIIILVGQISLLSQKSAKDWEKEDKKHTEKEWLYSALTTLFLLGILGAFQVVGNKTQGVLQDLFFWVHAPGETLFVGFLAVVLGLVVLAVGAGVGIKIFQSRMEDWAKYVLIGVLAIFLFGLVGYGNRQAFAGLFSHDQPLATNLWLCLMFVLSGIGVVFAGWGGTEFKVLRAQMPYWIRLSATGGIGILLFCLLSPWSLLDYSGFMSSQNYEWHVVSIADACYVLQFKDSLRYLYQLQNLMSVELWWPLGVTVVLGMVWVLGRFFVQLARPAKTGTLLPAPFFKGWGFKFSLADLLLVGWFIAYFGFIGAWNTKFIRYMVPLIPAFCIFGARFLMDALEWAKGRFSHQRFLKPVVLALVLGPSLFYSMAYMHIYRVPHTWIESSVWIFKHIPQNSIVMTEAWDDGLPTGVDHQMDSRVEGTMGPQNYQHKDITPYEMHGFPTDDSPIKRNYYANLIPTGEYISLASKKLWYTLTDSTPEFRPNGFNAYPITSRYYRCLWSGLLGYKMIAEFHSFPTLFGWEHPDDMAEESFSVYDHPRVYLFKKVETVTPERILKLLDSDDYVKGIDRDRMRTITPDNVDAFIAERHKYLEDHGLLKRLDEEAPVTVASTAPVLPPGTTPPSPSSKPAMVVPPLNHRKGHPVPTVVETPVPTPELKVEAPITVPKLPSIKTLAVLKSYADHPVIETDISHPVAKPEESFFYQIRAWLSWVIFLILLGWLALPLALRVFAPFPSGAYSLSKILGFFVFAWIVWFWGNLPFGRFTIGTCWVWFFLLAALSTWVAWRDQKSLKSLWAKWGRVWLIQEGAFLVAFAAFTLVKIFMPHIHDPVGEGYNGGGEAGMDYGFLASVVRGESFPPQNMWMAGLPIGYSFYYGHLMMGILTKTLGLVPAVTYNLGLITLFATIFSGSFGLAFALSGRLSSGWIAGALCAVAGNPDGIKQILDAIHQCFQSRNLGPLFSHTYDFWGPTRVIPNSINEFPYFSVLYGDMHAHTLAQPFAILLIAIIASIYMATAPRVFNFKKDGFSFFAAGLLLGGIAFLNTWEVPPWVILLGIALAVRALAGLNLKVLQKGLGLSFGVIVLFLTLLGWWAVIRPGGNTHGLGGTTPGLIIFGGLGFITAAVWLFKQKPTVGFALQLIKIAVGLVVILAVAGILWSPFLAHFMPQQNTVLWVLPSIRTAVKDYFGIHGFFLGVLLLSFLPVFSPQIWKWIEKPKKEKGGLDAFLNKVVTVFEGVVLPKGPVQGMMALGLASLFVLWGASWAHWAETPDALFGTLGSVLHWDALSHLSTSRVFATLAAGLFLAAVYFKDNWILWAVEGVLALSWVGTISLRGIHFYQDAPLSLDLGFFSILWLFGFFQLGLAVKSQKDRALSFAYLLASFFFLVTATVEIFVMSEYFGFGEGMRNNSLFKYYIVAWEVASIATGVFLPKVLEFGWTSLRKIKREAPMPRLVLAGVSGLFLFVLVKAFLDNFFPYLPVMAISVLDVAFLIFLLVWGGISNWLKGDIEKISILAVGAVLIVFSFFPLLPQAGYGTALFVLEGWGDALGRTVLFPLVLTTAILVATYFLLEGRKDRGRLMVFGGWGSLAGVLLVAICVYPVFATYRKCHGFLPSLRQQWTGYKESPTLNGLEYIHLTNPEDDAAIRFLNDHIPDQPCLVEFVGEGYNSWGSRFSIFTGIPALMGWDGHVGEWVGKWLGDDIRKRFDATETVFQNNDPLYVKKVLDAYGVRLVMVGSLERRGVPGRKGGYPPEGLAKFSTFLPLIYKNPGVEIYYNPPAENKL